jgi:hypothetical protein
VAESTTEQDSIEVKEVEASRERFDQEVVRRVFEFGSELVKEIPELEVLAVVPVWGVPQENLIPAIYMTRSGAGMSPHQLLLAIDRFTSAMEYKLTRVRDLLEATGDMLNNQAGEMNENQEAITSQKAKVKELEEQLENLKKKTAKK